MKKKIIRILILVSIFMSSIPMSLMFSSKVEAVTVPSGYTFIKKLSVNMADKNVAYTKGILGSVDFYLNDPDISKATSIFLILYPNTFASSNPGYTNAKLNMILANGSTPARFETDAPTIISASENLPIVSSGSTYTTSAQTATLNFSAGTLVKYPQLDLLWNLTGTKSGKQQWTNWGMWMEGISQETSTVTSNYKDLSGNLISPSISQTGNVGSVYSTSPKNIPGYKLVRTPSNASGVYGLSDINVDYIYDTSNTAPVVKLPKVSDSTTTTSYILTGGTVMDTTSADMSVSYTLDGGTSVLLPKVTNTNKGNDLPFGDIQLTGLSVGTHTIKVSAKDTEGLASNVVSFTLTVNKPVPGQPVTINYVDASDGTPIGPKQKVINGNVGDAFTEAAPSIPGYQNPTPTSITGTFSAQAQSFTIKYKRKQGAPVTLKYQDEQGATISPDETLTGLWGETQTVTPKAISGYQFLKQTGLTSDYKVTFGDTAQTVILTYKQGSLNLVSAPNLDFGNQKISGTKKTYTPSIDQALTVNDSRASGNWSMAVRLSQPLSATTNSKKQLVNNLFYTTQANQTVGINSANSIIYSSTQHSSGDTVISSNWNNGKGFHLDVLPGQAIADTYSGTMEWTLSDVPQ